MEVGLSSAIFYPTVNTEDTIKIISDIGFGTGEIFLNSLSEYEEDFLSILNEKIKYHNFNVNSVHAFGSPFEPYLFDAYSRRRKDMICIFKKVCRATKFLGAKYYTFHGMKFMDFSNLNDSLIIDVYNELAYIAKEEGISLCQENVSWCMSKDLNFLSMLKENLKYPISFTLDLKQAYKADVEPEEYIKVMGKDLANFHINDKNKDNICLLPGKGDINYSLIFKLLKDIGYEGEAIIEVYRENFKTYEDLKKAKTYIEKISNDIMK